MRIAARRRRRGRHLLAALACAGLLLASAVVRAGVLIHTARTGDTPESLAAEYYGNRALAPFLVEVNGLARGQHLPSGRHVRIPTAFRYRLRTGDSIESVAKRFLDDPRRAPFLAQWNGVAHGEHGYKTREGQELLVPFQFVHHVTAPESVAAIARTFYGDPAQSRVLLPYNFRASGSVLAPGDRLVVPILHVRLRAVHLARVEPSRAAREFVEAPRPQPDRREAELAARVAARLSRAEASWRDGSYNDVPAALTKLLSEEDPSEAQLVEVHRLLAFAYVALGAEEVAVKEFREVLDRAPDATLDPATVSPKIRAAFERARGPR